MWEIFLFINPLGEYCFKTEKTIMDFVKKQNISAHFNFVTITNLSNINDIMARMNLNLYDLQLRNEFTELVYDAALTYKAAACQGKKKARALLMTLQYSFNELNLSYSEDLVKRVSEKINLDYDELITDKQCEMVINSVKSDQLLAQEMNVTKTPSTVIFDYNSEDNNGVLLESCSEEELNDILMDLYQRNMTKAADIIDLRYFQQ